MKHLYKSFYFSRYWAPASLRSLLLLGLVGAGGAAQAQFAPFASYASPGGPSYAALADLNGDGRPDIVASSLSAGINVLLGQAGGTFGAASSYTTQPNGAPFGLKLGDVNGDGRPDAVVVNSNPGMGLSVLPGQVGGTFGPATNFPTSNGASTYNVALGDLNGDGRLDAVTTKGSGVEVFLGQAGGTLGTPTYFTTTNGSTYGLDLGDLNGDGHLDVVVSNFESSSGTTVSVLLGQGNGTLNSGVPYTVGTAPTGLKLGDLNGDGRLDLVVANYQSSNLGVLLGQAGGTFGPMTTYSTGGANPREVALADFNLDGRLDVVATNLGLLAGTAGTTVGVLLGQGNGTLGTATTYSTGSNSRPWGVTAGDVNGDGKPDIVTANRDNSTVSVLLSNVLTAPTATGASRCGAGSITLTASGAPAGGSYRWYTQATGGTAISGATGSSYTTPTLYASTTYYVSAVTAANEESPRTAVTATIGYVAPPSIVASGPTTINAGGSVTLTARPNLALSFTGLNSTSSQRVTTSLNASPAAMPNTTWEAWVYPTRTGYAVRQTVFSVDDGGYDRGLIIEANSSSWGVFTGTEAWLPTTVDLNQWQHVAVVYSSTGIRFYKNGVEYVYGGGPNTAGTTNRFTIGSNPGFLSESWQGQIDEARVWSMARSQSQIQNTMNNAPAGSTAGLAGFWRFNEGSGNTATDETGASNGALVNAPAYVTPGQSSIVASTYSWSPATGLNATNTATVTAAPDSTQTYTVSVSNGGTCASAAQQTVTVNLLTDLIVSTAQNIPAGSYNNITVTGTGAGTLTGAVSVAGALVVQDGGSLNTNCQPLTGAGSFTLHDGATLTICSAAGITSSGATGAVQVAGTRSFSADANYVYNGTTVQVTGNGLPAQVRNLTSTSINALTLSQPLAIRQVLTLNNGSLSTSGRALTLLSDASGTALIANLGTGTVAGAVTVQRYIDPTLNPGMGYRHLSAPVANTTVASFGSGGTALVVNPAYNTSATPNQVTPFPTIYAYDQARLASSPATTLSAFDKGWVSPSTLAEAAPLAARGFTVQLPGAQTLSFTGQVGNGNGTIPLTRASGATAADAGWNFIGNPYPSPLDFSTITASQRVNTDAAFYTYESTAQYVGQYRSFVNGVGNPLIGTAQAFFMRVSSGQTTGSLTLDNPNRVTSYGQQAPVRRGTDLRPLVRLTVQGSGSSLLDETYVYFENGATAGIDAEYDALKLPNPHGLNLATVAAGTGLAINGLPQLTAACVVPLTLYVPQAGSYTLTAADLLNLTGAQVYLHDAQTNQTIDLQQTGRYTFSTGTATSLPGRFELRFGPAGPLATQPGLTAAGIGLYPNPAHESFTVQLPAVSGVNQVQLGLYNSLGQQVRELTQPLGSTGLQAQLSVADLAPGVYVLRVQAGAATLTKRVVVAR